jgi:transcriptional/translational regulatory protein YebC/TACO1
MSKNNGSLGEPGCVAWIFEKKGVLRFSKDKHPDENALMESALEAGAEDLQDEGEYWEILTDPGSFEEVRDALQKTELESYESEITAVPKNSVSLGGKDAEQMLKLIDALEDQDEYGYFG